jgi:type II secretory pathway pseudopilin PulG
MTLLEALVSLVILGASAAGFLGVFQNSARAVQSSESWNRASAAAESALEEAVRSIREGAATAVPETGDLQRRTDVVPWTSNVDDIVVQVSMPDGRTMTVHRLVRRQ